MPHYGTLYDANCAVNGIELHCWRTTKFEPNDAICDSCLPLAFFSDKDECDDQTSTEDGSQVGNLKGTSIHDILETKAVRLALLIDADSANVKDDEEQNHIDKFPKYVEDCGLNDE